MKAKLKGQGGIKGLLLLHGEKIVIGLFALAAGYLAFAALRVERLPEQYRAENLSRQIQQTSAEIVSDANSWERAVREHPEKVSLDNESILADAISVDPTQYVGNGEVLSPHVYDKKTLRTDPTLLTAIDVRAYSGADLVSFNDQDVLDRYNLKMRREAEQKAADTERERARQAAEEARGGRGGAQPRRRNQDEETRGAGFDADHPNRRPVNRTGTDGGVPLQGGELIEFTRWVSVVAKVPIKNQMRLYRDVFENASGGYDPDRDAPVYRGFLVQRAEIVPGQDTPTWQDVQVYDVKGAPFQPPIARAMIGEAVTLLLDRAATSWTQGGYGEVVDPRFLYPYDCLVYPLPPLVGRDWGKEATHPDIPLLADAVEFNDIADAGSDDTSITPVGGQAVDPLGFGISTPGQGFNRGRSPAGRDQFRGRDNPRERGDFGGRESASRDSGRDSREGGRTGRGVVGSGQGMLPVGVSDYLLRFFDFTVEPGKRYQYRVKLIITDPNILMLATPNVLDPAVLERLRQIPKGPTGLPQRDYLLGEWSDPSPVVGVPLDGRVRLAGATAGDDAKASFLVDGFGRAPDTGVWVQASKLKDFSRGGIVNFVEDAEYLIDTRTHIDEYDSFKFHTGITVLDVRGGEKLSRDLQAPSRVMLMGPSGELKIRRELDDAPEVESHKAMFAKPRPGEGR